MKHGLWLPLASAYHRFADRMAIGAVVAALVGLPLAVHADLPKYGNKDTSLSRKVDEYVSAELRRQQLLATKTSDDAEFLRRLSLDFLGSTPPAVEVVKFLKDRNRNKRQEKIEEYIAHPMFVENLATIWTNNLLSRDTRTNRFSNRDMMEQYLRESFESNKPYNKMVYELLTATGISDEVPAVNYVVRFGTAPELAGHSARLFMGLQIQCSQCHNHPYEKWTQQDFWGYTAFFSALRRGRAGMQGDRFRPYYVRERGEAKAKYQVRGRPGSGKSAEEVFAEATPHFLNSKEEVDTSQGVREALAKAMISPKNKVFAKSIVNRVWNHLMGRGLVMPIDDMGENNPPTHPELLDLLADDFVSKGYDLKYLYRVLANTRTYQRSSQPRGGRYVGADFYAYANMKPMSPEQLFNSLMQATGMDERQRFNHPLKLKRWKERYLSQYVYNFANDEEEVIESFQGTIPQALLMMNGEIVAEGVKYQRGSNLMKLLQARKSVSDRIELMFLASLSRRPTSTEKRDIGRYLMSKRSSNQAYEDVYWALLNTTEFMFNH